MLTCFQPENERHELPARVLDILPGYPAAGLLQRLPGREVGQLQGIHVIISVIVGNLVL